MAKKKLNPGQQTFDSFGSVLKLPAECYSGNRPNDHLRQFVEAHALPYDDESDDYRVSIFDTPITTTKVNAIYNMHTYWSKKPHEAIRHYIRHYTKPDEIVLDPFCGSGSTALAALIENRKVIAIDRSPAATFITKNYCSPVEPHELQTAFARLCQLVAPEISLLYATRCDNCKQEAQTYATVYSALYRCHRCLSLFPLFDAPKVKEGYNKVTYFCPVCKKRKIDEAVSLRSPREGSIPVVITYNCDHCCKQHERRIPYPRKDAEFRDLVHIEQIEKAPIKGWVPNISMMFVESQ